MNQLVVFFNDSAVHPSGVNAGGGESATLALAKAIKAQGWKVIACANLPDGDTVVEGIEFWNFGKDYSIDKVTSRLKNIGKFHCIASSIVHPFLFLKDNENCLSRVIVNHSPSESASGLDLSTVFNIIDMMLCVSEAQLQMIDEKYSAPQQTKIIRNGFDPNIFQYQGPEGRDFNHIVFVGRVDAWKGAHLLIDAFPALKKFFPNLKLSMYGDYQHWEPMVKMKEKIAAEQPDFHFMGKVPQSEIAAALRKAGLFVFPSICFESAGLGVVDAQASGCPVLGFDSGGVKEYLLDGECGVLQTDKSLEALIRKLYELLKAPELLAQFSRNCLTKARHRTWDVVAKEVTEVLQTIAKKSSNTSSKNTLDELMKLSEFYRVAHFSNCSVQQLLDDHQRIADAKTVTQILLEKVIQEEQGSSAVFLCQALQREKSGLKQEALELYRRAAQSADEKDWQPFFYLTLLLAELGDLKLAANNARQVLQRQPSFPMAEILQQVITAAG